ncbi:MAG: hypothetical protein PVJ15_04195 [Gammaproteobacteria bacterium]
MRPRSARETGLRKGLPGGIPGGLGSGVTGNFQVTDCIRKVGFRKPAP